MSKTRAKVLLFFILAVTPGFAIVCGSKEDGITDAEAVQQAKGNLRIVYARGDSSDSVTENIALPTAGENGVAIAWTKAPSDSAAIAISETADGDGNLMGTVTRPSDMNAMVTLTATLTKNDTSDTREFPLTVVLPCTASEMTAKLKADPPSLSGCSAASIRGANMPALISAGVTKEQLLAVWSADADTGFTPAQLKEGGVTVAEMRTARLTILQIYNGGVSIADLRSGGVADHLVFNEVCNTPQTIGTAPNPTITLKTTTLSATDTMLVLEGRTSGSSLRWIFSGMRTTFIGTHASGLTRMVGRATARLTNTAPLTSTLSIPLADVFSNPTVSTIHVNVSTTNIPLCPGR